jgi:hypothetical protein
MNAVIREVVSEELYRKALAERDAYHDLVCRVAIARAYERFGTIGHGKSIVLGDYVFRVWMDKDGPRAAVVPQ